MLLELQRDVDDNTLYISPRLNKVGRQQYQFLLKAAIESGDDASLADSLSNQNCFNTHEDRRTTQGVTSVRVPVTAPQTLSEGEFNRFYIRGLCLRAMNNGINELEVYRAKSVTRPRPESIALIGTLVNAQTLLDDLRQNPGVDTALGLPGGPNSGLSVRIKADTND